MDQEASLEDLITRITSIIEEETELLHRNDTSQLEAYCEKKNVVLLEFIRTLAAFNSTNEPSGVFADAGRLNVAIRKNQSVLETQWAAVREFASFLESEMRRDETDGTYGRSLGMSGSH